MTNPKADSLAHELEQYWHTPLSRKASRYVSKFFDCTRIGDTIAGRVRGNYGTYSVSISLDSGWIKSICSCYIGKQGACHHCEALATAFQRDPSKFTIVEPQTVKSISTVKSLADLKRYLDQITLDELTKELRAKGITQKALAESIRVNPQHITSMKSSERRNRYFTELGAMKLACLWVLENINE